MCELTRDGLPVKASFRLLHAATHMAVRSKESPNFRKELSHKEKRTILETAVDSLGFVGRQDIESEFPDHANAGKMDCEKA